MSLVPHDKEYEPDLALYARHALKGQTPPSLLAMSVGVNRERKRLQIRAHFDRPPSEDGEELVGVIGAEVISQWVLSGWGIDEDWEVLSPGQRPNALPGGIAFRRGDPEPPMVKPKELETTRDSKSVLSRTPGTPPSPRPLSTRCGRP